MQGASGGSNASMDCESPRGALKGNKKDSAPTKGGEWSSGDSPSHRSGGHKYVPVVSTQVVTGSLLPVDLSTQGPPPQPVALDLSALPPGVVVPLIPHQAALDATHTLSNYVNVTLGQYTAPQTYPSYYPPPQTSGVTETGATVRTNERGEESPMVCVQQSPVASH